MDIKIRQATEKDFDGVLRINRNAYKEVSSDPNFGDWAFLKRPSKSNMLKWFRKLLADTGKGNAISLLAEVDGKVVGHCFVRRIEPESELSHVGELSIIVDGAYRHKGIGGKLLDSIINRSRNGFEMLRLGVFADNKVAKRLYKSRGFRYFGTEPGFAKRGTRYFDNEYYYLYLR